MMKGKTRVLGAEKLGDRGEVILTSCHSASFRCQRNLLKLMELFQLSPWSVREWQQIFE